MPLPSLPRRLQAALLLGCLLFHAAGFAQVTFTRLGLLPGSEVSNVFTVSADGSVVIGSGFADGVEVATRWTAASGMTVLGGASIHPTAVSGDGAIVAGLGSTPDGDTHAFRWTSSGTTDLGVLPGHDHTQSEAYGVSTDGSVIVGNSSVGGYMDLRAFRWTQSGGLQEIVVPDGTNARAYGVSGDGSTVVGAFSNAQGNDQAFRWTSSTGAVGIVAPGSLYSQASGISSDGTTVIGTAGALNGDPRGFRWTNATGIQELGELVPGDSTLFQTLGVSADGVAVGGYVADHTYRPTAVFWGADGTAQSLATFLTGSGIDLTGWTSLYEIDGVFGKDGLYGFIGRGEFEGNIESFRVTGITLGGSAIPEPAHSAALAGALGALALLVARRSARDKARA